MTAAAFRIDAAQFMEAGRPYLSSRLLAETLGVTLSELAVLAGVSRNTLSAKAAARKLDVALSPLVRILVLASEMTGETGRAVIWFKHQPIPGWGGKTGYDLVREKKVEKVIAYLEAVRAGVYA